MLNAENKSRKASQESESHFLSILKASSAKILSELMAKSASDESLSAKYEDIERAIHMVVTGMLPSKYNVEQLEKRLKSIRGH